MKLAAPALLLLIFFFSCKCSLHITVMLLHRQSNVLLLPQMWKLDGQSNFPSYTQLVSHLIRSWKKHQGGETPCSIWRNRLTFQVVLHVEARKKHIPVFNCCTTLQAVHDNNAQPFQSMSVWGKAHLSAGGKEEMFVPEEGFTPSPHPSFLYSLAECHRGSRCGSFKCQHVNRIMEQDVLTGTSNGQKFDARNVRSDVTYSLKKRRWEPLWYIKHGVILCGEWNIDPGARPLSCLERCGQERSEVKMCRAIPSLTFLVTLKKKYWTQCVFINWPVLTAKCNIIFCLMWDANKYIKQPKCQSSRPGGFSRGQRSDCEWPFVSMWR